MKQTLDLDIEQEQQEQPKRKLVSMRMVSLDRTPEEWEALIKRARENSSHARTILGQPSYEENPLDYARHND